MRFIGAASSRMKTPGFILASILSLAPVTAALAHSLTGDDVHSHQRMDLAALSEPATPVWFIAQNSTPLPPDFPLQRAVSPDKPRQAVSFEKFLPKTSVRWDEKFLYVESNGMPDHSMMVGITSWQQQVPLPQQYTGNNAWRIPLVPVASANPVSIKGRFLRGAIALAANGIPIFNPQNNRGEVAAVIGELDKWGGHCGRADDYHYHAAPLHLQTRVGVGQPIAYALDGYPILGLTEADGSVPSGLDAFNGHSAPGAGYHYHASLKYPYVNGGFHGEVIEKDGQVDPQPRAQPVRESLQALRGAKITAFESPAANQYKLTYELNAERRAVAYAIQADGSVLFEFQNGREGTSRHTHTAGGGGGLRPGGTPEKGGRPPGPPSQEIAAENIPVPKVPKLPEFALRSSEVKDGGPLPAEYTGDGAGSTLPLEWNAGPAGTKGYALLMHHLDPQGKTKTYWILYDIDPNVRSLPKNVKGVGRLGASFRGREGYEPPHSKGPGPKTYVLSLYALSQPLGLQENEAKVTLPIFIKAMEGKVIAGADLNVVYTSNSSTKESEKGQGGRPQRTPPPPQPPR